MSVASLASACLAAWSRAVSAYSASRSAPAAFARSLSRAPSRAWSSSICLEAACSPRGGGGRQPCLPGAGEASRGGGVGGAPRASLGLGGVLAGRGRGLGRVREGLGRAREGLGRPGAPRASRGCRSSGSQPPPPPLAWPLQPRAPPGAPRGSPPRLGSARAACPSPRPPTAARSERAQRRAQRGLRTTRSAAASLIATRAWATCSCTLSVASAAARCSSRRRPTARSAEAMPAGRLREGSHPPAPLLARGAVSRQAQTWTWWSEEVV